MKRVLCAITGTIVGLVGLLSFKSHTATTLSATKLPSAALPGASSSAGSASATATAGATSAPPNPTTSAPSTTASGTATPAKSGAATPAKTASGTSVQTRYGIVQVQVTVAGNKITNVQFLQLTSDDGRSADINSQAGPLLLQETLSAQSANVDTISGATYTSEGYKQSLQSALDQAGFK